MNRRIASTTMVFLACAGAAFLLAACGDREPVTITDVRDRKDLRFDPVLTDMPLWRRFGMPPPQGGAALVWDLPEGWKVAAPTQMRPYNFVVEADPEASAYLTVLPKRAGTLADNVNRWRSQVGLEPLDAAGIEALPKKPFLGNEALFVDVAGRFTPMGGGAPKADWHLLGLMFESEVRHVFFKMVGPAATVEANRDAFLALAASFRVTDGSSASGAPRPAPAKRATLTWTTPEGWTEQGRSGMREMTFAVEGSKASCWVLFLGGTAGGLAANVNRWLGEVGQEALSEEAIARLPRLDVLGTQGVLVEGEGDYAGMGGPQTEGARLYGLICPLAGRTLFVKMVGPAAEMKAQREKFIALCESLTLSE